MGKDSMQSFVLLVKMCPNDPHVGANTYIYFILWKPLGEDG